MGFKIRVLGAAGTVTGSRFLIEYADRSVLIDCGLFQGGRKMKARNWEPFPIRPERLGAVFLTHAHIDHTGYLPRLVAQGFDGPVYATEATCALARGDAPSRGRPPSLVIAVIVVHAAFVGFVAFVAFVAFVTFVTPRIACIVPRVVIEGFLTSRRTEVVGFPHVF
jgi:glyoxylase-like metal-dependent hydrolase (beta-lactamase superfamily II)